jgi:hypothetical protein
LASPLSPRAAPTPEPPARPPRSQQPAAAPSALFPLSTGDQLYSTSSLLAWSPLGNPHLQSADEDRPDQFPIRAVPVGPGRPTIGIPSDIVPTRYPDIEPVQDPPGAARSISSLPLLPPARRRTAVSPPLPPRTGISTSNRVSLPRPEAGDAHASSGRSSIPSDLAGAPPSRRARAAASAAWSLPLSWLLGGPVCAHSSSFLAAPALSLCLASIPCHCARGPKAISIPCRGFDRPDSLPFPYHRLCRAQRREGRILLARPSPRPAARFGRLASAFCGRFRAVSVGASLPRSLRSHWFMVPSAIVGQQPALSNPSRLDDSQQSIQRASSTWSSSRTPVRRRGPFRHNEHLRVNCSPPSPHPSLIEAPCICGFVLPYIRRPSPNHLHRHRLSLGAAGAQNAFATTEGTTPLSEHRDAVTGLTSRPGRGDVLGAGHQRLGSDGWFWHHQSRCAQLFR